MKGWYGNKQAHSLASKGIKTKANGEEYSKKPFYVDLPNGILIREGYNSIPLSDIYAELIARQNADMIPDSWKIEKNINGIYLTLPENKRIIDDMKYLLRDLGIIEHEEPKKVESKKPERKEIDALQSRKDITKMKEDILKKERVLNKLRRGLSTPEDLGYTNVSKKDIMTELEKELEDLRLSIKVLEKELILHEKKGKSINRKEDKTEKSINNKNNYHIRRN